VHESERNRLLKRQRMLGLAMNDMREAESAARLLVLAMSDMSQAERAARALSTVNPGDIHLRRALGTAVVVSYARAFTQSTIVTLCPKEYEPPDKELAALHHRILDLRDSESAHTDKKARREISVEGVLKELAGQKNVRVVGEEFYPVLSPEELSLALRLFELQHVRFRDEAIAIGDQLSAT
jgi:hypothetical protein